MSESNLRAISIFGLGYVGTVTSGCLCEKGYRVVGVDTQQQKVAAINSGGSPIMEPEVGAIIAASVANGSLFATCDVEEAVRGSNISIICVGTPSLPNGSLDLQYVNKVVGEVADALHTKELPHVLVLRSTMLPGSTGGLVEGKLKSLVDTGLLEVLFVPEFLREGSAVSDFRNPSLSVVGSQDGSIRTRAIIDLFNGGDSCHLVLWEEAETVKYACNAFHALKVGFANEIGRLCKGSDIDSRTVMDIVCDDHRLNISSRYLRPGNPFGGSCLPKDVSALKSWAARSGISSPLIDATLATNRAHQDELVEIVLRDGRKRVGILGLTFKPATDDLRNSPMVFLAEVLLGKGYEISIYDQHLNTDSLVGSNRSVMTDTLPHLNRLLQRKAELVISNSDILVVSQPCVDVELLRGLVLSTHRVIDVNSWADLEGLAGDYEGLCWPRTSLARVR